jgi:hypothetical protein
MFHDKVSCAIMLEATLCGAQLAEVGYQLSIVQQL